MKIYLTTDTHFNHQRMVTEGWRPEGYEYLIQEEFGRLTKDDILIHLGDVCMGKDAEAHKQYIAPLPCKKWLVLGNHDRKSLTWYMDYWDVACRRLTIDAFGKRILFSHKPQEDNGTFEVNIHGHLHDLHRDYEVEQTDKHILLALEDQYLDYQLTTVKEALDA